MRPSRTRVAALIAALAASTIALPADAQTKPKSKIGASMTIKKQIGEQPRPGRLLRLLGCQRRPFPACAEVYNNRSDPNPYFWRLDNNCTTTLTYHVDIAGRPDDVDRIRPGYRITWNDTRIRHITWCGY